MIEQSIQELIQYGIAKELVTEEDSIFLRNQLMDLLRLSSWETPALPEVLPSIDEILDKLVSYATENGIIADSNAARDLFDTRIMGLLTDMPHTVNRAFFTAYHKSPEEATDWYYQYSKDTNYVRAGRIAKDMRWTYDCEYGTLDVTINRSKPEKDPRDIAAAKNQPQTKYPACQLCIENTGFAGTLTHPARQNLRPIPISIHGGNWAFQYSPYGYYNEHCIVFNQKHVPMVIDAAVFEKLFDILDMFPHYFIGSNADLPIVGGSILSHEHFQGGHYTFAMAKAPIETPFLLPNQPEVQAEHCKVAMSVIRLQSENRSALAAACDHVLTLWRSTPMLRRISLQRLTAHRTTPLPPSPGCVAGCMNATWYCAITVPHRNVPWDCSPQHIPAPHQKGKHRSDRSYGSGSSAGSPCERTAAVGKGVVQRHRPYSDAVSRQPRRLAGRGQVSPSGGRR
ncbi:MAG: hypothetical protein ACLT3Y_02455 [Ruminococcus callidus]